MGGNGGNTTGGGGGGGRVHINVPETFSFVGTYSLSGGNSPNAQAGGAGYAKIVTKISGKTNEKLYVDNGDVNGVSVASSNFAEGDDTTLELDELYVGAQTTLTLYGMNLRLDVKSLTCDANKALIYIPDNTIFTANKGSQSSVIDCSFTVDAEGELRLPQRVTLVGESTFKGIKSGIEI